ncbi:ankyrin repeat-containing domain protein [Trichophaea hybrida]|nr:ankyrin repeat-containing domain protein [Trichophaea hybrida]
MNTLGFAAEAGDLDFVRSLLPICNNKSAICWRSLFNSATRSGSEELVEYLLGHVPEFDLRAVLERPNTDNLWYAAAKNGLEGIIRQLIASGRGHPQVCTSALHAAITRGSEPIVLMLLESGAGIEDSNFIRGTPICTPLHAAVFARNISLVRLLLDRGADVIRMGPSCKHGDTALHIAARLGLTDIAELLIVRGADVHARDSKDERPLNAASRNGSKDMVAFLLRHGAELCPPGSNISPLHSAVRGVRASKEVIKFLIDSGLNVNIETPNGEMPLHLAAEFGSLDVVEFLIELGADPNAKTAFGCTPLHATLKDHPPITLKGALTARTLRTIQLLGEKADAEAKNLGLWNVTQIENTSPTARLQFISALISIGANVHTEYEGGKNLLFLSWRAVTEKVVKLLLEQGVNARAVDDRGDTIFHHFAQELAKFKIVRSISLTRRRMVKKDFDIAIKLIAAAGADLNAINHASERAIDVLRAQGIEIPAEGNIQSN